MRPPLSPTVHGLLEYAVVPVWALAPSNLRMEGASATLAWVLAAGVLSAATLTDYPLGLVRLVPIRVHGWIDRVATPLVIAAPWLLGFDGEPRARSLFVGMGTLGLIVTWLTDFRPPGERLGPRSSSAMPTR